MTQTMWAAVTGAGDQEDTTHAGSADAGAARPQVAVITAAGQALAFVDTVFFGTQQCVSMGCVFVVYILAGDRQFWLCMMQSVCQIFLLQETQPRHSVYATEICIQQTYIMHQLQTVQACKTMVAAQHSVTDQQSSGSFP